MEPVLIAGAGPVGLTTALLLANWGIPTTVLEAQRGHEDVGSRAICFQRDVLDIFDRIGCADAMVAEGLTWTTSRTFYREHQLFTATFPDPAAGQLPPWTNVSQDSVERCLLAKALIEPLITLRFGHPVTAIADRRRPDRGDGWRQPPSPAVTWSRPTAPAARSGNCSASNSTASPTPTSS